MGSISYDRRSFTVNGRKVWIISGAIHYFRVPRELWRDRLLKLKRAGCNTVETYVAWNAHEPAEGRFDFTGGLDLDGFLTLAAELGLWAIVRPGPYICAEWDNGGIPAWLNAKPKVRLRVANPVYHRHVKAFFEQVIPIIAAHQVTRGGNVILVQDENEFFFINRPGGREHLVFLKNLLRRLGIDVPIIVCNFLSERIEGTLECWNCWSHPERGVETLAKAQGEAPNLITEFWPGWFYAWGHKEMMPVKTARETHAASLRILAAGGMYNYYMFHGGTNFGYFPGRTVGGDDIFMISSYDYDAPLSEAGGLTDKYYKAKLASVLGSNLASFFAGSEADTLNVTSTDNVEIIVRTSGQGHIIFVFNRSTRKRSARLMLPGGVPLDISFADVDALALPYGFSPVPGFTIDYSNLSLLGMMPVGVGRLVFLYGPRGKSAVLAAQDRVFRRTVGPDTQIWFGHFPNLVAVMDTQRAERTWFLSDRTVVGGDFVGEADGENVAASSRDDGETLVSYFPNGRVNFAACSGPVAPPKLPKLSKWKKRPLLPKARPSGAVQIDDGKGGFAPLEAHGYFGGYGWYHTKVQSAAAREATLLLSDAADRVTAFVNGRRAGTFGPGRAASTGLLKLPLRKGANHLHLLLDNLGRFNYGLSLGETKGIRGPVYLDARRVSPRLSWTAGRYNGKLASTWQMETEWPGVKQVAATQSVVFEAAGGQGATMRLRDIDEPAAIFLNREFHSYFWGRAQAKMTDVTFPDSSLKNGRNLVELAFFVKPEKDLRRRVSLFVFDESKRVMGPWYWKALEAPKSRLNAARIPAETPVAYETTFALKDPPLPVFLVTKGMKKGEVWLNGRMVSRHWEVGPQHKAYLPEPWLTGRNKLVIVDEYGASPSKVRLEYDPLGLTRCR